MTKIFPGKYDRRWLAFYIIMTAVLGAVLVICKISFFNFAINTQNIFSMFIIAIVLASITSAAGYFGARIICTFSLIGTFIGIIFMIYVYLTRTGWEDIAGLLIFIMIYIIFSAIGTAVEIINYYKHRQKELWCKIWCVLDLKSRHLNNLYCYSKM